MVVLSGKAVSPGYAVGPAYVYCPVDHAISGEPIAADAVEQGIQQFHQAVETAGKELEQLIHSLTGSTGAENAKIFSAHKEILEDEELLEAVEEEIRDNRSRPDLAVENAVEMFCGILGNAADPLIASRTADLRDVKNRLLRVLRGEKTRGLADLPVGSVVVARDLLPSDTASLNPAHVAAILTEIGGETSHSAILARKLGIPAVLGVEGACEALEGHVVAVDAVKGLVTRDPKREEQEEIHRQRDAFSKEQEITRTFREAPARTADGVAVDIGLNIGSAGDDNFAGCDFVGLLRTEFLYMESDRLPDEEQQLETYREILKRAGGRPVTLRTLDIGGDKSLPYLPLPREENPFLGQRALRLCLSQPELFQTQLRAALRASAFGPLSIMFPMVGSLDDLRAAKEQVAIAKDQLTQRGQAFDDKVPLGIMVEIPSIAMVADLAAKEADFASIGTNDLCQYLCAADRMNPAVDGYYQSYSPAMLRTIARIAQAFEQQGKPVSVCGEMGGDPGATKLLVGLGVRKLSMNESAVARVKRELTRFTLADAQATAQAALECATEAEVKALVRE